MKLLSSLFAAAVVTTLVGLAPSAGAQTAVKRIGSPQSFIASAIWAGDTLYLSGALPAPTPGDPAKGTKPVIEGDTRAQTLNTLRVIEATLKEQGLGMGDVVQMRVYMVGDPAQGGKLDFAGMNEAYKTFFGTPAQPNKPVRATVQVAALVVPNALVEIEVMAVRSK